MTHISSFNNFTYFLMSLKAPSLSLKAKEAIKVGLAFSITVLITLKFGWLNPFWAGFAVSQIALFSNGQSLHNGALRVAGLFPAILAALLIFAIAAQDRWIFAILTSLWMVLTTYLMIRDEKHSYMWNVAGFAALYILVTTFSSSADIFDAAMARALDTTLGIVVYTLVTVFVWPESNIGALTQITTKLASVQANTFNLLDSQTYSPEAKSSIKTSIKQEIQLRNALKQALFAKGSETHEVQEAAPFWREFYRLSTKLSESYNRLNNSFLGLENVEIARLIPKLDSYKEEISRRFELTGDLLSHGLKEHSLEAMHWEVDEDYLKSLSVFDQLAFASSRKEFNKIERLSRKLVQCASNIVDDSVSADVVIPKVHQNFYERMVPDFDYVKRVWFVGAFTMTVFSIWIFFDPPGHMKWIQIPPTVAMIVAATPQMKTNNMVVPAIFILAFFIMVYTIIMPKLSGAIELGLLFFIAFFLVFYFLKGVYKLLGVIAATSKLMVNNEQTYNFANSVNMALLSVMAYATIYVFSYIINSPRPQRAFLNHLHRYFKSAHFLAVEARQSRKRGPFKKFQIAFHRYEIRTLPLKIKSWSAAISQKDFPENSPEAIEDLIIMLYSLSGSIEEWLDSNALHQTRSMLSELKEELETWNRGFQRAFSTYQHHLGAPLSQEIKDALKQHIDTMEAIINRHSEEIKSLNISAQEKENIYRLIGSYQGLTLSLSSYALVSEQLNWEHWKEEVFA